MSEIYVTLLEKFFCRSEKSYKTLLKNKKIVYTPAESIGFTGIIA